MWNKKKDHYETYKISDIFPYYILTSQLEQKIEDILAKYNLGLNDIIVPEKYVIK